MTRIAVLGGTGYTGTNIVREAVAHGIQVTAYSRSAPSEPVEGATYVQTSFLNEGALAAAVADQDVVVEALAARGDLTGRLDGIVGDLAKLTAKQDARLVVIGGWSALRSAEGGPRLAGSDVPAEFRAEANEMVGALDTLEQSAPTDLDWLYVSPAQTYGFNNPGEASGHYRIGGAVALVDDNGESAISGADFALAIVEEIARHEHRAQINVAY